MTAPTQPHSRPARSLFVTTALPYANGPLHLGHIMEYIQADIWVRAQRMAGHAVHWMGADDTHGAPIMLQAEKAGITPEQLIEQVAATRPAYLTGFHLSFDHWYTTHSPENQALLEDIYHKLTAAGLMYRKPVEQLYDPVKQMFLADRYIKGQCPNPKCNALDQYGDGCEVCGNVYAATDLIEPRSVLTGATPVQRSSDHYFFKMSDARVFDYLTQWIAQSERLQSSVANKAREWLTGNAEGSGEQVLQDKDISRDAPYFGFPIPDAPGKFFYVWLDAPIGYLAALKHYFDSGEARKRGETRSYSEFMAALDVEQIHFIGKDIIFFHVLQWPALLHFTGRKTPDRINVHGFITVAGAKMSKSRGTGVSPLRYLEVGLNPEWLRYYIAAKLNANVEDIEFNPDDFMARVNSDLVGKYVNIASRTAPFLAKFFDNRMPQTSVPLRSVIAASDALMAILHAEEIHTAYANREFGKALRLTMQIADGVNALFDAKKPWVLSKDASTNPDSRQSLADICALSIFAFKALTLFLKPVLPKLAADVETYLRCEPLQWSALQDLEKFLPAGHEFGVFKPLITRVDPKQLDALFAAPEESTKPAATAPPAAPAANAPAAAPGEITVEDFAKMDIRIAKILAAEPVEGADKLVKVTVDVGDGVRTIFAGIKSAYTPEQLVGRLTLVLANLKPRKMRFGTSEGMVLAAGPGGKEIFLLSPDSGAAPGMKVK